VTYGNIFNDMKHRAASLRRLRL